MRATVNSKDRQPAVLFDVDGTLVDSNYLHVSAWQRAFGELDMAVETWRVHRSIGMDGAMLVDEHSGGADDDVQDQLTKLHAKYYAETTSLLRPLPGAREVMDRIAALGLQVVLATSAPQDELATLREVLDRDDLISAVTSSEDVDTAKPEPDIVATALDKAGVPADKAVFVGDAVWDVEACVRAGVPCIGVLSGGFSRGELEAAGASAVYENALELSENLDDSPIGELLRLGTKR